MPTFVVDELVFECPHTAGATTAGGGLGHLTLLLTFSTCSNKLATSFIFLKWLKMKMAAAAGGGGGGGAPVVPCVCVQQLQALESAANIKHTPRVTGSTFIQFTAVNNIDCRLEAHAF